MQCLPKRRKKTAAERLNGKSERVTIKTIMQDNVVELALLREKTGSLTGENMRLKAENDQLRAAQSVEERVDIERNKVSVY